MFLTTDSAHLLGLQQAAVGDRTPLLVVGDQLVVQETEDAVGLHDAVLKVLVLLGGARRCGETGTPTQTST